MDIIFVALAVCAAASQRYGREEWRQAQLLGGSFGPQAVVQAR